MCWQLNLIKDGEIPELKKIYPVKSKAIIHYRYFKLPAPIQIHNPYIVRKYKAGQIEKLIKMTFNMAKLYPYASPIFFYGYRSDFVPIDTDWRLHIIDFNNQDLINILRFMVRKLIERDLLH